VAVAGIMAVAVVQVVIKLQLAFPYQLQQITP
jgi:hypothetical protein